MFKFLSLNYVLKVSSGILCLSLSTATLLHAAVSVVDDEGATITLQQPAERIISLAPHITESLFAAGAGNKIIGAVSYSDYPEAAHSTDQLFTVAMHKVLH